MKKSLIALAVLGAVSGAASAQSSVTMYGIVDVGVAVQRAGRQHRHDGSAHLYAGKRLGHRQWHPVGQPPGRARFGSPRPQLERGIRPRDGLRRLHRHVAAGWPPVRPPGLWWPAPHDRFGTFVFGRIATPSSGTGDFDLFGAVDPFGTGFRHPGPAGDVHPVELRCVKTTRWPGRRRPGRGSSLARSTRPTSITAETAPQDTNTKAYNLGANWTWGPLFLAATYDVIAVRLTTRCV